MGSSMKWGCAPNTFSLIRALPFGTLLCYHENMKKAWIIYTLVMPILVVVALRIYVSLHSQDIDPIDDSDLLLVRPVIAAKDNAYPVFANATNVFYLPEAYDLLAYLCEPTTGAKITQEEIVSLLESNKLFFAAIQDGAQRNFCFRDSPLQAPMAADELLQMNLVLLIKARRQMEAGNANEALDTVLLSLRLGQLVGRDAEYIVEALAGLTIISRTLFYAEKLAEHETVTPNRITKLLTQLGELENLKTGFENGSKTEYAWAVNDGINRVDTLSQNNLAFRLARKAVGENYVFKPNTTKKVLAAYWRRQIEKLNNPDKVLPPFDTLEYELPQGRIQRTLFFLQENSVGRILLSVALLGDVSYPETIRSTEEKVIAIKKKLLLKQKQ